MKELLKKRILFFMAFGISKAIVFLAPLLLSNTLTKTDYGVLEYAMNIGFIGAAILSLGVPTAYPYFKLKRQFKSIYEGFVIHYLYLFLSSLILLFCILLFKNKLEYILSVLFIYTLSNQIAYSTIDKTNEKIVKAVIIDSLFYVALLLGYVVIIMTNNYSIQNILYASILYSLIFVIVTIFKFKNTNLSNGFKKHLKLIKYGKGVMISGLLILLIANSGRVLIEYVFQDKELIAIFSFYFRMASFVVIIHQILNIIYFKRIYTFSVEKLDFYFTVFLGLIVISTTIMYFLIPLIGPYFFKLFDTFSKYQNTYLILCFQMIFWILLANNENVIYREKLATKMNIGFITLLLIFSLLVITFKTEINFEIAIFILYLLIVLAVFIQFFVLYKLKIKLIRSTVISILIFLSSLILIRW